MAGKQPNFFKYAHEAKYGTKEEDGSPRNRVGSGWENFFTEAVAFFLQADRHALEKVCRELLGNRPEVPERVETQVGADDGTADIAISFKSGRQCFIESKIDAPLGPGQPGKYLGGSCDDDGPFVALFSRRHHKVPSAVLECAHFLKPANGGNHFLWRHLYDWIRHEPSTMGNVRLRRYFCNYMEWLRLGWSPGNRWALLFEDRRIDENAQVRDAFAERLAGVWGILEKLDYSVTKADRYALVARPLASTPRPFKHIVVKPSQTRKEYLEEPLERFVGAAVLSVSLVYENTSYMPKHAEELFAEFGGQAFGAYQWVRVNPYKMTNDRWRLEFAANLEPFLSADPHEMAARLSAGCNEILDRLSSLIA